jgi:hypothetical protein
MGEGVPVCRVGVATLAVVVTVTIQVDVGTMGDAKRLGHVYRLIRVGGGKTILP